LTTLTDGRRRRIAGHANARVGFAFAGGTVATKLANLAIGGRIRTIPQIAGASAIVDLQRIGVPTPTRRRRIADDAGAWVALAFWGKDIAAERAEVIGERIGARAVSARPRRAKDSQRSRVGARVGRRSRAGHSVAWIRLALALIAAELARLARRRVGAGAVRAGAACVVDDERLGILARVGGWNRASDAFAGIVFALTVGATELTALVCRSV
jgi:hypothetical protein